VNQRYREGNRTGAGIIVGIPLENDGMQRGGDYNGGRDTFHFFTPIKIRFRDLDVFGHVNNAVYFTYMEMTRTEYFTHVGLLKDGWPPIFFIVAEATCQFKAPLQMDTDLIVKARVSGIGNSSFVMGYHFVEQRAEQLMAIGRTVQVMYDYPAGRSVPMPDEWRAALTTFEGL
jgi:acyl-CoA thioester hydrolase